MARARFLILAGSNRGVDARGFSPGTPVFPSRKTDNIFKIPIRPLRGDTTSKEWFI